ncbi:arsenic transporter [Bordetella tumulicola]|uniref:arsenic transporter n=1 Tax=Bordetella tumulicola TaxID=1649133 RepID=UPI0039F1115E
MLLPAAIFIATLILVIWQPRGLNIGWSALAGAIVALLTGVVQLNDVVAVWHIVWNATATFIAIIITSIILDAAGFFKWAALHVARWGGGRGHWLFALIVLLGAAVSALFANDGAALILTPIVMEMLLALGFGLSATLAFVMAAGFIADTASTPLIVSNLVNIVSADFFDIGFGRYASVMMPVNIVAVVASLGVLLAVFHKQIPSRYNVAQLQPPRSAIRDHTTFQVGMAILILLLAGFFILEPLGIPISAIAATGALVLLLVAGQQHIVGTRRIMREAPWHIVVFSLGMYLVVYGLRNAGLTAYLTRLLDYFGDQGLWTATLGTGVVTAFLASVLNNLPAVLVGALAIADTSTTGVIRDAMIYANVIGTDLGPKITPIGSLATLLWLHVLARKGLRITWGYYFKIGIVLTLPVLLVTLAALAIRLQ